MGLRKGTDGREREVFFLDNLYLSSQQVNSLKVLKFMNYHGKETKQETIFPIILTVRVTVTRIGKTVRKRELPCTVSGNVNMHGHLGSNLSVYKCTIHVDLEILLLGIDLHRRKAVYLLKESCQGVLWLKLLVSYPFSILFLPTVYLVVVRSLLKTDISQTPL